ncbi:MAG: hypothetical protein R3E90_15545 [Marinicella sp.]|nr:hypothetical protein [Xanthomonadales bacterium]
MSNPTIVVKLASLDAGSVPAVTQQVDVAEGGQLDVNVTWPTSASNSITCDLQFTGGDQDPFNDEANGDTSFPLTRATNGDSATQTLQIMNDASLTTDTYCLTLTIDGQNYSTDPTIIIDPD